MLDTISILSTVLSLTYLHIKWRLYQCKCFQFSSVGSVVTLCDPMDCSMQAFLSIPNAQSLLKLMSIKLVTPSNHPILCCPLLLMPSVFPSIRVFSSEWVLHIRWPKVLEFQLQHQSFQWIFSALRGCFLVSKANAHSKGWEIVIFLPKSCPWLSS